MLRRYAARRRACYKRALLRDFAEVLAAARYARAHADAAATRVQS